MVILGAFDLIQVMKTSECECHLEEWFLYGEHIQPFRNSRIMPINPANSAAHSTMAVRVAFTARPFSHQVAGRMPCTRNVVTPARFTQIRFIRNSDNAPIASAGYPPPSSSPNATSGGNNATATITPISVVDTPVVNAS